MQVDSQVAKGPTKKEAVEKLLSGYSRALMEAGITERALAKQLKRELKAKESRRVKIKGAVSPEALPRGRRLILTSGKTVLDKDGNEVSGDGETVVEWDEVAWDVQQRARMDAQKLLGLYPAERVDGEIRLGQAGELMELAIAAFRKTREPKEGPNG